MLREVYTVYYVRVRHDNSSHVYLPVSGQRECAGSRLACACHAPTERSPPSCGQDDQHGETKRPPRQRRTAATWRLCVEKTSAVRGQDSVVFAHARALLCAVCLPVKSRHFILLEHILPTLACHALRHAGICRAVPRTNEIMLVCNSPIVCILVLFKCSLIYTIHNIQFHK